MALLDWLVDNADTIWGVGTDIYDYVNKGDVTDQLYSGATSSIVDPFGEQNRLWAQGMLRDVYGGDYSYLKNLPGYQFGLDQTTQSVERQLAKRGHYLGSGAGHDLAKAIAGYNAQFAGPEIDRIERMAGAGMQPAATAYASLLSTAGGADIGNVGTLKDIGTTPKNDGLLDILQKGYKSLNFDGALGESVGGFFDSLGGSLGIDFGKFGADAKQWFGDTFGIDTSGMGDSFEGFMADSGLGDVDWGSAGKRLLAGEDPQEVLKDTAVDWVKNKGKDYVTDKAKEFISDKFGGDAGADSGYGDAPGPDVQTVQEPLAGGYTDPLAGATSFADAGLENLIQAGFAGGEGGATAAAPLFDAGYAATTGQQAALASEGAGLSGTGGTPTGTPELSGLANIGSLAGGALGGYLMGEATDGNTIGTTLGSIGGMAAGGAVGGAMAGTGAAAGASGAMASGLGGMGAGPLIPLALAMQAYGGWAENQALSKQAKTLAGSQFSPYLSGPETFTYGESGPAYRSLGEQFATSPTMPWSGGRGKAGTEGQFRQWTDPRTGQQFYVDQPAYDMLYSGDISQHMGLYNPNDGGQMVRQGMYDFGTGKIVGDELFQNMYAGEQAALKNEWTNFSRSDPIGTGGDQDRVGFGGSFTDWEKVAVNMGEGDTEMQWRRKGSVPNYDQEGR